MSAAGRIALLILGLSVAAYVVPPKTGTDVTDRFDEWQQEGQGSNLATPNKPALGRSEEPSFAFIEPTVVTIVEHPVEHSVALDQPLPRGRDAIGRELQKELKRVGCYTGELNGAWTKSTRQAMKDFTDRVNAKLPTDIPDSILLVLVQGHPNRVCGIPCPSGQSLSRTQQCTPNALLARTSGTTLAGAPGQRLAKVNGAWTVKTTVTSGAPVASAATEHTGDAAPVAPLASAADPPLQEPAPRRVTKKHWRPPARHERTWASDFFKQRDRFSFN